MLEIACASINDLAVGDVGGTGVAVSGDDDEDLFGSAHHHAEDADLFACLSRPISQAHACMSFRCL